MKHYFILVLDNGGSYDEHNNWNAGVFSTLGKAFDEGVLKTKDYTDAQFNYFSAKIFYVEEYRLNDPKIIKVHGL